MSSDVDGLVKFTTTENLNTILAGDETVLLEDINNEIGYILGFSKIVEGVDVDTYLLDAVDVLEAELGQTTIDGHLTTFEADFLVITRTRLGTLVTTSGSTALARASTTTNAFRMLDGTFCGFEII